MSKGRKEEKVITVNKKEKAAVNSDDVVTTMPANALADPKKMGFGDIVTEMIDTPHGKVLSHQQFSRRFEALQGELNRRGKKIK